MIVFINSYCENTLYFTNVAFVKHLIQIWTLYCTVSFKNAKISCYFCAESVKSEQTVKQIGFCLDFGHN